MKRKHYFCRTSLWTSTRIYLKVNRKSLPQWVICSRLDISPLTGAPCTQFSLVCRACSLSQFRWKAQLIEEDQYEIVRLASLKLRNGKTFDARDKELVFPVLSQRLCIEPILVGSEAIELADRSVAHHMRLITGVSADRRTFHTHSPSEPILVLGAVDILHNTGEAKLLGRVLDTYSKDLCSSGLVEKGLLGEFGARVLLILARDFASLDEHGHSPNLSWLLKPVHLLKVIDTLLDKTWAGTDDREAYNKAFETAHVNFTHWVVTKDPLPEIPDQ